MTDCSFGRNFTKLTKTWTTYWYSWDWLHSSSVSLCDTNCSVLLESSPRQPCWSCTKGGSLSLKHTKAMDEFPCHPRWKHLHVMIDIVEVWFDENKRWAITHKPQRMCCLSCPFYFCLLNLSKVNSNTTNLKPPLYFILHLLPFKKKLSSCFFVVGKRAWI